MSGLGLEGGGVAIGQLAACLLLLLGLDSQGGHIRRPFGDKG